MPAATIFPIDLDLGAARSHQDFLALLGPAIESDELLAPFRFLLGGVTAYRIFAAKASAAQGMDPWLPSYRVQFVGENSSEAARLVDRSLQLYKELLGIESEAIYKLLEHITSEKSAALAVQLGKTNVRAARAQFEPTKEDADESTIERLAQIQAAGRRLLLSLHGRPGSPLNYAERAKLLTDLLAENITLLEERLRAVRRGFGIFFGVNLDPVPLWSDRPDAFSDLIMYSRHAVARVDELMQRSVVRTEQFLLGRDNLYQATTLVDAEGNQHVVDTVQRLLQLMTSHESVDSDIRFRLKESDLPGYGRKRVLDLVAMPVIAVSAWYFKNNLVPVPAPENIGERASAASLRQAQYSARLHGLRDVEFDIELFAPEQPKLDGRQSDLPSVRFKSSYWAPAMSLASDILPSGQGKEFGNISPHGDWILRIHRNATLGLDRRPIHSLLSLVGDVADLPAPPHAIIDILLSIRYAAEYEGE